MTKETSSFSFEYGEEEEEKRPDNSSSTKKIKTKKKVPKVEKTTIVEEAPVAPVIEVPQEPTPVVEQRITAFAPADNPQIKEPKEQTSSTVSVPSSPDKKKLDGSGVETAIVVAAVVATTTAVAVGSKALTKVKGTNNNPSPEKQQTQEEKKKEEQTKCDAKSEEVKQTILSTKPLVEKTNKKVGELKVPNLDQLTEKIAEVKKEIKKVKKKIKEIEQGDIYEKVSIGVIANRLW